MSEDQIRSTVLSSVEQSMASLMHPAGLTVNKSIYAHEESASLEGAVLEIRNGVLKIPASNMNLASTLTFVIPNSKIMDVFYLNGQITIPQWCSLKSKWFLDLVDQIQLQIPGSGALQYSGASWKDFLLRTSSKDQRNALNLMMPYVDASAGSTVVKFTCPVVTPWSSSLYTKSSFPIDADSLANNIILSINLKPFYQVCFATQSGGAHTRTLPTAFDALELKVLNLISHVNPEQSLAKMHEVYRTPAYYLQSYTVSGVALTGSQQSILLQQMPSAQLVSILIRVEDDAAYMTSNNAAASQTLVNPANIRLNQLRLNFNGLDLIDLTDKEIYVMQGYGGVGHDGDLSYTTVAATSNSVVTAVNYTEYLNVLECFALNTSRALTEGEYAITKNFNGYTMNLFFTAPAAVASSTITVTYVCNSVIEIDQGSSIIHY